MLLHIWGFTSCQRGQRQRRILQQIFNLWFSLCPIFWLVEKPCPRSPLEFHFHLKNFIWWPTCTVLLVGFAIWGDVCTYGILYSVGWLLDQATDRAAYKTPKVQKINEITPYCEVYISPRCRCPYKRNFLRYSNSLLSWLTLNLHRKGGWTDREILFWFVFCIVQFKNWYRPARAGTWKGMSPIAITRTGSIIFGMCEGSANQFFYMCTYCNVPTNLGLGDSHAIQLISSLSHQFPPL